MSNIKKVLLFEPDTHISRIVLDGFAIKPDYRVDFCSNLFQFGQKIDSFCPDYYAIILSGETLLRQPDSNYVLENIRNKNPFVRIVILSNTEDASLIKFMNEKKIDNIFRKGTSADEIIKFIEKPIQYTQTSVKPIETTNNFKNNSNIDFQNFSNLGLRSEENFSGGQNMNQNKGYPPNGFPPPQNNQGGFPQSNGYPQQNPYNQPVQQMPPQHQNPYPQAPNQNSGYPQNPQPNYPQNGGYGQQGGFPQQPQRQQFQGNPMQQPQQPQGYPQQPMQNPMQQGGQYYPPQQMNGMQGMNGMMPNIPQKVIRIANKTVITVHSPKGGVGKSTISKELAVTYAMSAQSQNMRVCLVDMNIDYGNIAIMLDVKPVKTMATWARNISQRCADISAQNDGRFDKNDVKYSWEEIENHYLLKHSSGLYILAAPTNHRDAGIIGDIEAEIMIENLKNYFDILILDTGPDIKDVTFISLEKADHLLLVCNMEIPTLNDLDQLKKTLKAIGYDFSKIAVVMNETSEQQEADAIETVRYLQFDRLIGIVPKSQQVAIANDKGTALSQGFGESSFTIAIKKIANALCPIVKAPSAGPMKKNKADKQSKGFSLFGKKK